MEKRELKRDTFYTLNEAWPFEVYSFARNRSVIPPYTPVCRPTREHLPKYTLLGVSPKFKPIHISLKNPRKLINTYGLRQVNPCTFPDPQKLLNSRKDSNLLLIQAVNFVLHLFSKMITIKMTGRRQLPFLMQSCVITGNMRLFSTNSAKSQQFIITAYDHVDSLERRQQARPAHLARALGAEVISLLINRIHSLISYN